jgi:transcriptional regulator with XRE-family HTH domain
MGYNFGEKIREVRENRKITMKEVAEKAGLSESLISQIERNKVSPAIDTLLKIIDILDIDLDYIFSDFKKDRSVNLVRKGEGNKMIQGHVIYEQLSHTVSEKEEHDIEAYILEIEPGSFSGSREYGHIGKELGVIMQGSGEFKIGNKVIRLNEGDSISFSSDVPHILMNTDSKPLKAFWVITPPKMFVKK